MKQKEVKLAAVGTGGIWNAHATNLALLGGNQIVAICEIDKDRRREVMDACGARGCEDISEMLESQGEIETSDGAPPGASHHFEEMRAFL